MPPKDAFQERKKELVKLMPIKLFIEKKINPRPGMTLAINDMLVKIISVSGGRVLVDFNNPLAGKIIIYNFEIKRKIDNIDEKINSIMDFFIKQRLGFKIENNQVVIETQDLYKQLIEMLNQQFKEVLGMEIIFKEKKEEKEIS